ncbi:hypothetical protein VNO80_28609 [Phaseolus coccineus]|uniref:Uncharacterized protein n=1 Tax=Phaseolus coccineus TaxID=3886 RepID=A0AAN9LEI8_PHACN
MRFDAYVNEPEAAFLRFVSTNGVRDGGIWVVRSRIFVNILLGLATWVIQLIGACHVGDSAYWGLPRG